MDRIFRISGAAVLAASALALALASTPALAGSLTCTPTTVSVAPSAGNLLVTCTEVPPSGTPPPACSVSVSPSTLSSAGGAVNVTASNCGTITSWTGAQSTSAQAAVTANPVPSTFTDTLPPNSGTSAVPYAYSVVGSSGSNSATAFVSGASSGGTGGSTSCGTPISIPWGSPSYTFVTVSGSAVVQFTVPATTPAGTRGVLQLSTLSGGSFNVTYAFASAPCVFPTAPDPVLGGGAAFTTSSGSIPYSFQVGGPPNSGVYMLQPGMTYYLNIKATHKTIQIYVTPN